MYNNELYHYGVKGMKWGHRKARGHAGPGKYVTKKRQQAGDKRDLEALNKGQHLSVGLTKKRQAKFDARDKAAIEKRMAKNEAENNNGSQKKTVDRIKGIFGKKMSDLKNEMHEERRKELERRIFPYKEEQEKLNRLGRVPTRKEEIDRLNRLGRVPTRKEERERQNRYNI